MELFAFDDDYVRRLRQGDRDTAAHFEAYFRDLLLIKLRRRLATADAIEDVRQEVFLRVLNKLADLRDGRKLGAFVNSICNHVLMEHYRDDARASRTDAPAPAPEESEDIERELVDEETRARVRRVLSRMDGREPDILGARLYIQMTDANPKEVKLDLPVEMTFRKIHDAGGTPNYYWKVTPAR